MEDSPIQFRRIKRHEAVKYGFNAETKELRFKMSTSIWESILTDRKLEHEHPGLKEFCEMEGVPIDTVSHYWAKGEFYSVFAKQKMPTYEEIRDDLIEEMRKYAPKYPKIERKVPEHGHLLVIDPADIHIGKIASTLETKVPYNSQIAIKRAMDGVKGILDKSASYNIEHILFVIGNDILHIDTPKGTTTSGTVMDTDGMWYDNFRMARKLYTDIIELLLQIAPVHVTFNPSNHDYMSGFQLADAVSCWFHNNDDVVFDVSMAHRKYFRYGENLIGTTHGDGAKKNSLPILMAQESKTDWALTKYRYIYTHHVHRKMAEDIIGISIESLRAITPADSWHHRNGFEHNPLAIEGFVHDPKHGQVARFTHLF